MPTRPQQLGRDGLSRARRAAEARFAAWALDTGLRLDRSERAGELRQIAEVGPRRELRDRQGMSVVLASILRRDSTAIDVGAHSGAVLREILRIAPEGRHIAYEPLPTLARQLAAEFPGVDVRNAALSDTNGSVDFIHVTAAPEFSGMLERDYGAYADSPRTTITVPAERLDDVLPAGFVPDLIKIDVEGAELLVMRGAVEAPAPSAGGRLRARHRRRRSLRLRPGGSLRSARGAHRVADLRPRWRGPIFPRAIRRGLPRADLELPRRSLNARGVG